MNSLVKKEKHSMEMVISGIRIPAPFVSAVGVGVSPGLAGSTSSKASKHSLEKSQSHYRVAVVRTLCLFSGRA